MNLEDALGGWPAGGNQNQSQGGPWPGQNTNPTWPGQSGGGGAWPGQPGQPNQPSQPTWPGQPNQPSQPTWPGQPGQPNQPSQPTWPGQPSQPSQSGGWSNPSAGPGPGPGCGPSVPVAPQRSLAVPYKQDLPSGVHDKLLITITGTTKPNANKITVDLSTSHDLAFHFNPRFNDNGKKVIVRNSCIGKKWGKEERELKHFPFTPGHQFELKIMCTNREFKVAVNNAHLLEFKHRINDLRSINRLNIYYDLDLTGVNVETLH